MMNNNYIKCIALFLLGGFAYCLIEVMTRGYSHISMFLAGGACFLVVGRISISLGERTPMFIKMIIGALLITIIEFITGIIVNVWLGLNIWDYSGQRMNLLGQICMMFSLIWFLISFPIIEIYRLLNYIF